MIEALDETPENRFFVCGLWVRIEQVNCFTCRSVYVYLSNLWILALISDPAIIMSDDTVDLTHLPLPLQNIIYSFNHLKDDVRIALLTQLGDAARIQLHVQACQQLRADIAQVSHPNITFPHI